MEQAINERLEFAQQLSVEAADLILGYYRSEGLRVDWKQDASPVTRADREAEQLMRARIGEQFASDGVLGEEAGETGGSSGFRWILDPIDGTKAFMHGVEQFGTLIGLEYEQIPVAGVCRFPALGEMLSAARGQGAVWERRDKVKVEARTSNVDRLDEALLCFTELDGWSEIERLDTFQRLCESVRFARGWGDCYGHMLVATGRADVIIDPVMNIWDAAALLPIVTEAGGHFLDLSGAATISGGSGISVNDPLRAAVMKLVSG